MLQQQHMNGIIEEMFAKDFAKEFKETLLGFSKKVELIFFVFFMFNQFIFPRFIFGVRNWHLTSFVVARGSLSLFSRLFFINQLTAKRQ
jgi:hypothetical protein